VSHLSTTDFSFDLSHLQRSISDLSAFHLAYRSIKAWAKERGIYASRLSFLGGFHITLLFSWICKLRPRRRRCSGHGYHLHLL
jgi:poly(A) polymerase Pap1